MVFKKILLMVFFGFVTFSIANANEKITVVLDWYLNPDHAPLIVAEQIGSFKKLGLDVDIITPSDPSIGPRLVAAGKADLAMTYQQQLYMFAEQKLPLVRVGTLIDTPLNSIMALSTSNIISPKDLKGKKIGFSVSGVEEALLSAILKKQSLSLADVQMVNVNFNLVSALIAGQVDAVIGAFRNVESNEIIEQGFKPTILKIQDLGVPPYDELVIVARRDQAHQSKYLAFLKAIEEATAYLKVHPDETWLRFAASHKNLASDLNKKIWLTTAPLFANNPMKLDQKRYESYGQFLFDNKIISQNYPVSSYAIELK